MDRRKIGGFGGYNDEGKAMNDEWSDESSSNEFSGVASIVFQRGDGCTEVGSGEEHGGEGGGEGGKVSSDGDVDCNGGSSDAGGAEALSEGVNDC